MNAMMKPPMRHLCDLAFEWQEAKALEKQANERRIDIENQIAALVGVREEGVTSLECGDYKIKTTGKLTRSVNSDELQAYWGNLPSEVQKCFTWKASVDTKTLRSIESLRDDLTPIISQFITTKPAKPAISIEAINNGN